MYCVGHIGIAFLTAVFLRTLTRGVTVGMAIVLGNPSTVQIMCDPVGLWKFKILHF